MGTLPDLKTTLAQVTKEKQLKSNEVEDLLRKLDAAKEDLQKSKGQTGKLEQAIAVSNQDLKDKTGKIGGLTSEIDRLKKKSETSEKSTAAELQKLKDQLM